MSTESRHPARFISETFLLHRVPLVKQDTEEYRKREAEANKIAQEVENDKISSERTAKEDGDEEQQFSAVIRPTNEPPQVYSNRNQSQRRKPQNQMSGPGIVGSRRKGPPNNNASASSNTHSKYHTHSYS